VFKKYLLEFTLVGMEIGLAVLGIFENIGEKITWWQRLFENGQKATSAIMLVMVALLAAYVAIKMAIESGKGNEIKTEIAAQNSGLREITSRMEHTIKRYFDPQNRLEIIPEQDFYERFTASLRKASTLAYLAHLDIYPPSNYYLEGTPAFAYYKGIFEIIKTNRTLKVQNCMDRAAYKAT
jgi:hypothetical protein